MDTTNNKRGLNGNERGFASIVIALTLIIVLALLTVGFAQLARREQQGSLDKQQSNQAYYAAESGINDAVKDIASGTICDTLCTGSNHPDTSNYPSASSPSCMTPSTASYGNKLLPANALTANSTIDQSDSASYSCLLVNLSPQSLNFTNTPPNNGQYLSFTTTSGLSTMTIEWGSSDGQSTFVKSTDYTAGAQLPPLATWKAAKHPPVILFSLTPTGGTISHASLVNNTFNTYLYPESDTGSFNGSNPNPGGTSPASIVSATSAQGQIVPGNCGHNGTITYPCAVTISNLSGGTNYVLHFVAYYDNANVSIVGTDNGAPPAAIHFVGQAQVDVTGKAQNVLKRVQVYLAAPSTPGAVIGNQPIEPDNALEGQNVCKRFDTYGGSTTPDTLPGCSLN